MLTTIEDWLQQMADKYINLFVYDFNPERFLEDNKGFYVAVVPNSTFKQGEITINQTDTSCREGSVIEMRGRYFVIWRLPEISEAIFNATLVETSYLGRVINATTDVRNLFSRLYDEQYVPPGDREFVAYEVEISAAVTRNKKKCECLLTCF
jgi:hypothetical protein